MIGFATIMPADGDEIADELEVLGRSHCRARRWLMETLSTGVRPGQPVTNSRDAERASRPIPELNIGRQHAWIESMSSGSSSELKPLKHSADLDLVDRALSGEPVSVREFQDTYRPLLERVLMSRGVDRVQAEDLVADIVAECFGAGKNGQTRPLLEKFEGRSSLSTWMIRTTWNRMSGHNLNCACQFGLEEKPSVCSTSNRLHMSFQKLTNA